MTPTKLPHIEVILPIYNEAKSLPTLLSQLELAQNELKEEATFSYLFVDDGSTDDSRSILKHWAEKKKNLRVIPLLHNFGHSAAITCGLAHFSPTADAAILMDADLQDNPSAIPALFDEWKKGAQTAVAERGSRKERNAILFKAFYRILHWLSPSLPPINFGTYCLLDKKVVARIHQLKEHHRYFPGLVSFASDKITPVRVDRERRAHGQSRVGPLGLLHLAISAFVGFSNAPVRLASILGLLSSATALLSAIGIILVKLFTDRAIPGWASIMTAIFFGSGTQLLCVGIIGEYIARIYDEVRHRPPYLVDTAGLDTHTEENLQPTPETEPLPEASRNY